MIVQTCEDKEGCFCIWKQWFEHLINLDKSSHQCKQHNAKLVGDVCVPFNSGCNNVVAGLILPTRFNFNEIHTFSCRVVSLKRLWVSPLIVQTVSSVCLALLWNLQVNIKPTPLVYFTVITIKIYCSRVKSQIWLKEYKAHSACG